MTSDLRSGQFRSGQVSGFNVYIQSKLLQCMPVVDVVMVETIRFIQDRIGEGGGEQGSLQHLC